MKDYGYRDPRAALAAVKRLRARLRKNARCAVRRPPDVRPPLLRTDLERKLLAAKRWLAEREIAHCRPPDSGAQLSTLLQKQAE